MKYILIFILFLSCDPRQQLPLKQKSKTRSYGWNSIKQEKAIDFVFTNSSVSYEKGKDGEPEGFEYELAKNFADSHDLEFRYKTVDSVDQILNQLSIANGYIGAASITNTEKRQENYSFSPSYFTVNQVVVCRVNHRVKGTKDLTKLKLIIPTQSSYTETLRFLKSLNPELTWEEREEENSETMLHTVWNNPKYCTIVDSHVASLHQRYLPELKVVFKFKTPNNIGWVYNKNFPKLGQKIEQWFKLDSTKELINNLKRKYFDFIKFDPFNLKVFNERIQTRLPTYIKEFKKASKKQNIEWELLAAVSYQESFWDKKAKSPTGVRGIMMLTLKTAKDMGVKNRLNPKESIQGGAKYLARLIKRIPSYVKQEDRIWYALAAYNVGYYHLRDAMALAIWQNEDPTSWHSIEKVLPLLAQKKYYKRLPYGHARGLEPVLYVKRIKDFYDILKSKPKF